MTTTCNPLPKLPRLVLRIGFAGSARLPLDSSALKGRLDQIFEVLAQRLAEIAPSTPIYCEVPEPQITCFYAQDQNPLLRLVSGLCEGADALAAVQFERLKQHKALNPHLDTELAAVIPFELPVYRASRPSDYRLEFDRLAAGCSYIVALDGRYEKPTPDTECAKARRARAYRAQSTLLLRHADILLAVVDADGVGRAGGTLETVRTALIFDLPVVLVHPGSGAVRLIEPQDDLASVLADPVAAEHDWKSRLRSWITTIVADPDTEREPRKPVSGKHAQTVGHGHQLLEEFFHVVEMPPARQNAEGERERKKSYTERWVWGTFEKRFRILSDRKLGRDTEFQPYLGLRERATWLNYHYVGLYRGAFLLNYGLAAVAVLLAASSLALFVYTPTGSPWLHPSLVGLGVTKLLCVLIIYLNTHRATLGDWIEKAVDYRYLAERLRSLYYLPCLGSFQPPAPTPPTYDARAVRQSAVDWMFEAILRSISPSSLENLVQRETFEFGDTRYAVAILRPDPLAVLAKVRDPWIQQQAIYHDRNARLMERVAKWVERSGKACNLAVIGIVIFDLIIGLVVWTDLLPFLTHLLHDWLTPGLIALTAVLPAAVASLNGIRFQSECSRLAERSAMMRTVLEGRMPNIPQGSKLAEADALKQQIEKGKADPETDLASWTPSVLRLAESVATVLVREVAEWSVLYAKEVPEP